nr:ParB/RepB/Spo0J family partition protein [Kibdelosporangium sp. MJ126-NF4]CEL18014.1 StrR protein [Kibdelosporangium sp. MJ126-NF4]CTQ90758.1 StrR protein [Kibdelosporangium sp. MJ126-NF4]
MNEGVSRIAVAALLPADSPRCAGESDEHVRALANSGAVLPPIIVHRSSMRVIDGMHRLKAAQARGHAQIDVRFFDGNEADAFVLAVRANTTHGLPLSSADREASAIRIFATHPEWSDRAIAAATGLSTRTVSAIRARTTGAGHQLNTRVGRDGRVRPVDPAAGRRRAHQVIRTRPTASVRDIAREAGVGIGTARDVRERLRRGEDPVPEGLRRPAAQDNELLPLLRNLMKDPSLRFTEHGRKLLRVLGAIAMSAEEYKPMAKVVPHYCATAVAELARRCADVCRELAEELEKRERYEGIS